MESSKRYDPLSVRLPDGMRDRIRERAAANRRSMNSEIVHYLDRALADQQEENGAASAATDPRPAINHP